MNFVNQTFAPNTIDRVIFMSDYGADSGGKGFIALDRKYDLVIDDAIVNIESYLKYSTAKIILYERPWNKSFVLDTPEKRERINIVKNWVEISNLLK